jgi:site-specific DNA-adenine methylase
MGESNSLGIPYMGSKRTIAKDIVDYMIRSNPNATHYYDLFGGGGAISFELLKRGKKVVYNELNTGVVRLIEKIMDDGITPEFYEWVDKEKFNKYRNDDTWLGGLIKTCWSFGNNQKDYLFGAEIQEDKRLLHEIIVNRCEISQNAFRDKNGVYVEDYYLEKDDIHKRRLEVKRMIKSTIGRVDLQRLQQLQQLQQLERLEQLGQLEQLVISNMSYSDVEITTSAEETIIYLDPPYINTRKYQKGICHNELNNYIEKSPYKIYISSYESDFEEVFSVHKRCTVGANINSKVIEKLFCNRAEERSLTLF